MPVSVQESLVGMGWQWPAAGWGSTEFSSACMGPFKGSQHYLPLPHHSLEVQKTGRTTVLPINRKIGLGLS